ncbi:MAG: peptide ABC transporter substrate-binding protein [Chloroflexi bacterium]|nr:peptide ABC transporter substrate-binding protein [Chloroflexota bacterium]
MQRRCWWIGLVVVLTMGMGGPVTMSQAEDTEVTIVAMLQTDVPVTLDSATASEISTLDPALASDTVSLTPIENLFLGLTDVDPFTNEIVPELAQSWEVSADGTVWTFHLRSDVNWMRYDPASDTAGIVRPVVADDFVFGIKRTCDPRLGGYYGTVAAKVISGCDIINQTPSNNLTDDAVYGDTIQVQTLDEQTLAITLQYPAAFFFAMTPMWMLRPVPAEVIREYGDEWTAPGNIVTNGPFFIQELTRGLQRVFVRNTALPIELFGYRSNLEKVVQLVIEDQGTAFALYIDNKTDSAAVPPAELQNVLADPDFEGEVRQVFDLSVFYFGFIEDKAPFNNVQVRRAFSAIIDRDAFVNQVRGGRGIPMIHFTPTGIAYAPPINEIGVGFDPDYAKDQLSLGGYTDCKGMPPITIATYSGAGPWAEFLVSSAEQYLGCDTTIFTIEQFEFSVLLESIAPDVLTDERPNMFTLGWGPGYGDAHSWLSDVLSCTALNRFQRQCTSVDDLMDTAARSNDPALRTELYAEIEEAFFGPFGEFPIAPLFLRSDFVLIKTWYTGPFETDALFGGTHWNSQTIDMAAKLAARAG